jgi:hypothetical protein
MKQQYSGALTESPVVDPAVFNPAKMPFDWRERHHGGVFSV